MYITEDDFQKTVALQRADRALINIIGRAMARRCEHTAYLQTLHARTKLMLSQQLNNELTNRSGTSELR